jgi:hypothetical protein
VVSDLDSEHGDPKPNPQPNHSSSSSQSSVGNPRRFLVHLNRRSFRCT